MPSTEEAIPSGKDAGNHFFCSAQDVAEFKRFMSYEPPPDKPQDHKLPGASDRPPQFTADRDVKTLKPPEDSTSRTFASFGDKGTTASVSAYGDIIQITKYFGVGKSGFFCVDLPGQREPWFVERRAQNLLDYSTDSSKRIGLIIPENWKGKPHLDFVHDRWPRYRGETEHLSISIQYTVRDDAVIQKYSIQKQHEEAKSFRFQCNGIGIRQMEWLDDGNDFNEIDPPEIFEKHQTGNQKSSYQGICGPNGSSFNLIHHFHGLVEEKEDQKNRTGQTLENEAEVSSSDSRAASSQSPEDALQHGDDLPGRKYKKERPHILNETRKPAAVGLVMAVFVNNKAQEFGNDGSMSVHMSERVKYLDITVAYRLQLLSSNGNGWQSSLISPSEICKPPLYRTPNHDPISFSRNLHVDFTVRRNLEHILSVCAINTATKFVWDEESRVFTESTAENPTFALTCGDFAGHHIVSSASFFAFQFLLEIANFLEDSTCKGASKKQTHGMSAEYERGSLTVVKEGLSEITPNAHSDTDMKPVIENAASDEPRLYMREQLDRIFEVCKGHLIWTFQNAWKDGRAHFGGNHWASGDPINFPAHWSSARRPPSSLADTPFQIIKAFEFAKCWSNDESSRETSNSKVEQGNREMGRQAPSSPVFSEQSTQDHTHDGNYLDEEEILHKPVAANAAEGKNDSEVQSNSLENDPMDPTNSVEFKAWEFAKSLVKGKVKPWIDDLARKNKRMRFAFSRSTENGVSNFRLEDHAWIWMALSRLEDFELDSELTPGQSELLGDDQNRKITSKDAQKNMLRRFTLEETFLKERLLATSRTVRESRFLFRSRDTALFYAMEHGFFGSDQSRLTPWMNTIDIQKFHEHNDDAQWENPLRYGLAMVMSSIRRWQINQKTANKMFSDAAMVLLYSARSNGLFPGEFDPENKEPATFSEQYYRNSYWSTCFELPYILWVYGKPFLDKTPGIKPKLPQKRGRKSGDRIQATTSTATYIQEGILATTVQPLDGTTEGVSHIRREFDTLSKPESSTQKRARDTQAAIDALTVKKTMPFNDFIDQKSVVEPSDDWLYSFPDFLDFDPNLQSREKIMSKVTKLSDPYRSDRHFSTTNLLADGARGLQETSESTSGVTSTSEHTFPTDSDRKGRASIVDVQKSKQRKKGSSPKSNSTNMYWLPMRNQFLWVMLNRMRSEQMAKKRIIWLPSPNKETALLCYLGSPESQHDAVIDFFDRHHSYEHYFFDDTIAVQNIWETELHLPFYQLLGDDDKTNAHADAEFLPPRREISSPALSGKRIVRAAIGFRFLGDFLDRYWTCHIIECIPGQRYDRANLGYKIAQLTSGSGTWKQRKVLELMLFDIMLSEILNGVTGILQALSVGEKPPVALSGITRNDYLDLQERSQSQRYILQILEEDLKESLEQIESWKNREVDRSQERPRWTKNDERKYRGPINKMVRSNERKIRKLRNHHTQIQSLRTELLNTQQQYRDDLNFLGAEDIKYFTYVTVVFLPLGFAASIFSMSEAPPGAVLTSMIVTAITALLLTIFALVSAKTIASFFSTISHGFNKAITGITSNSVLFKHYNNRGVRPATNNKDVSNQFESPHTKQSLPNIARALWWCWFWVVYITQELPGRQFGIAYKTWQLWYPEGMRQPTLLQWAAAALHTGAWVLQLPLKLGIVFTISLTRSVCWLALGFRELFLTVKSPIAFVIAMIFSPIFAISYVVNIMWLNIYDTALWSASKQSMQSKTRDQNQLPSKEPTEEAPTGVSTQQNDHSESEKSAHQGESIERFLLYSKASRPFQKHEPKENSGEGVLNGSQTMDMGKAIRNIFEKPPSWPERKKRFGAFSV